MAQGLEQITASVEVRADRVVEALLAFAADHRGEVKDREVIAVDRGKDGVAVAHVAGDDELGAGEGARPSVAWTVVLDGAHSDQLARYLDDLGAWKMTDWMNDTLFYILNSRYMAKRPTVIVG